jgi:hypothetical protein
MTRYDAVGTMERDSLGPTTPEMAAIMGSLGARDAVMLDDVSAQLLSRCRCGAAAMARHPQSAARADRPASRNGDRRE